MQQPEYKDPGTRGMRSDHYLSDLPGRELQEAGGRWGLNLRPDEGDMVGNHLIEIFVREYQGNEMGLSSDGDRHPWEKVYLALGGKGSSILKRSDEPERVVNWEKGDLFIVEANELMTWVHALARLQIHPAHLLCRVRRPHILRISGRWGEVREPIH